MQFKNIVLALLLAGLLAVPVAAADIYLVRHSEKVADDSKDPELSGLGRLRAAHLATMLRGADVERILTTDFKRTRDTALPLAEESGLEIEIYDPGELQTLATRLLALDENTLVVGHSNTTSELVDLLGGDGGPPIVEAWEYDRLYLVQTASGAVTQTILLHIPPRTDPPIDKK